MFWRRKSYEDTLPALAVRRVELRKSLRMVTLAWMFGVVWAAAIAGTQMKIHARMIGFDDFAFGLMAAIPFVATFGQLIAAVIIERTGLRKQQFLYAAGVHRIIWLGIAALPLVMEPGPAAVAVALGILAVSWFAEAMARPAWFTWMGDLIPRRIRGRYMARREQLALLVQIALVIAIGVVLDRFSLAPLPGGEPVPQTPQAQPALMYVCVGVFIVAALSGTVDILLFLRVREVLPARPTPPIAPDLHVLQSLLVEPFRDGAFRNYVGFGSLLTFSITCSSWYFWLRATDQLGFSNLATNVLFMVIGPVASIIAAPWWGRLIDRWGRKPVLQVGTFGLFLSLLPWFFASPDQLGPRWLADGVNHVAAWAAGLLGQGDYVLVGPDAPVGAFLWAALGCIIGGGTWTGVNNAQLGIMLSFADGPGRSKFLAASGVLISVGGIAGGAVGGWVAEAAHWLKDNPWGPFQWTNYHLTFAMACLTRVMACFWLLGMPDRGARSVRDLMRYMGSNVYNAVSSRLFYPLRVLGWGQTVRRDSGDDKDRR